MLPLDDRRFERFNPDLAGRPQLIRGSSQLLYEGMGRLSENSVLALKNKSHAVTAQIEVPEGGAEGVIVAQGGAYAGWSLYLHGGARPTATTSSRLERYKVAGEAAARRRRAPGADGVRLRRRGLGKGGDVTLYVDGAKVGEGRVEHTVPDGLLGGRDDRRRPRQRDSGERRPRARQRASPAASCWVQLDVDEAAEDLDHLISPEERLRLAMARQ